MKKTPTLLILLILCCASGVMAQKQVSGWIADFNTIRLNNKFSVHADLQFRSSDKLEHLQTMLLRGGLNYNVAKGFVLTGGYAFIQNRRVLNDISGTAIEHRFWEQLIFNHGFNLGEGRKLGSTLQHRLRLEQRFIPVSHVVGGELQTSDRDYAGRLRYFFRNVTPLHPWSSTGSAPFLAIQNEVFLNVHKKSVVNDKVFDQNRLYLALGYRFSKKFDLEAGYMNQYTQGRGNNFSNNHIVQLATYVRL